MNERTDALRQRIRLDGELLVSRELNGTDSHYTWEVVVSFKSFQGRVSKHSSKMAPVEMEGLIEIAITKLIDSVERHNKLTRELLGQLAIEEAGNV